MESTWESRDLPVLDAIVRRFDESPFAILNVGDVANLVGLEAGSVLSACRALDGVYIEMDYVMAGGRPDPHHVRAVTPEARRVVGQWPSGEQWVERLVRALNEAAEVEPDEDRRSKLRTAAQTLGGIARQVAVAVATAGITHATGL